METIREEKVNKEVKDKIDKRAIKLKKTVELSNSAKDVNRMVDSLEKGVIVLHNKIDNTIQQKQSQDSNLEKSANKEKTVKICTSASSIPNKSKDNGRSL